MPDRSSIPRTDARSAATGLRSLLHDSRLPDRFNPQTDRIAAEIGCRPRVLLAELMPLDDLDPKYLLASALAQWGFDVDVGAPGRPPAQTARIAVENSVHAVFLLVNTPAAKGRLAAWIEGFRACGGDDETLLVCSFDPLGDIEPGIAAVSLRSDHAFFDKVEEILERMAAGAPAPRAPADYLDGVRAGDRRTVAEAISIIESDLPAHRPVAEAIATNLYPHSGNAIRIGISGVPGAGKSTFIDSFGMLLIERGFRVAVLAVDPSSQRTRGAVLGDKIRMPRLSEQENAFIRPTPSSGTLGGVARRTRETMIVCEAAGHDVVLVETVGVGQSEAHVAGMVDFFMVLLVAGAGDEFQGIKKGIIELADAIVITKADGDNIALAVEAQKDYEAALNIIKKGDALWAPPVLTCSTVSMQGICEILQTILDHQAKMKAAGEFDKKRRAQAVDWMWALVEEKLKGRFCRREAVRARLPEVVEAVKEGRKAPANAALELLAAAFGPSRHRGA